MPLKTSEGVQTDESGSHAHTPVLYACWSFQTGTAEKRLMTQEMNKWHAIYPEFCDKVVCEHWCGRKSLRMPHFATLKPDDRYNNLQLVRKSLSEKLMLNGWFMKMWLGETLEFIRAKEPWKLFYLTWLECANGKILRITGFIRRFQSWSIPLEVSIMTTVLRFERIFRKTAKRQWWTAPISSHGSKQTQAWRGCDSHTVWGCQITLRRRATIMIEAMRVLKCISTLGDCSGGVRLYRWRTDDDGSGTKRDSRDTGIVRISHCLWSLLVLPATIKGKYLSERDFLILFGLVSSWKSHIDVYRGGAQRDCDSTVYAVVAFPFGGALFGKAHSRGPRTHLI